MFYSIRHVTRFQYSAPVSESVMEVRMRPRSELQQQCLKFDLHVTPRARVQFHRDYLGNTVHYFDVPGHHVRLSLIAESVVEVAPSPEAPPSVSSDAWAILDAMFESAEMFEFQQPSNFTESTPGLEALAAEFAFKRRDDPLSLTREINTTLYNAFEYAPSTTKVDSPIDEALESRKGVCQDFTHIMLALLRRVRIPCRYVSGYLFHDSKHHDRSNPGATHAWIEAWIPGLGLNQQGLWIGFDPTNDALCSDRHIRAAIGRDYADVPPTRGIYKGRATSELSVAVRVLPTDAPADDKDELVLQPVGSTDGIVLPEDYWDQAQQQQQ